MCCSNSFSQNISLIFFQAAKVNSNSNIYFDVLPVLMSWSANCYKSKFNNYCLGF